MLSRLFELFRPWVNIEFIEMQVVKLTFPELNDESLLQHLSRVVFVLLDIV